MTIFWHFHFLEFFHCFSILKPITYVIILTDRASSCGNNSFIPILMLCSEQLNTSKFVPISILWYFGMWIHACLGIVIGSKFKVNFVSWNRVVLICWQICYAPRRHRFSIRFTSLFSILIFPVLVLLILKLSSFFMPQLKNLGMSHVHCFFCSFKKVDRTFIVFILIVL